MPMHPERAWPTIAGLLVVLALSACATTNTPSSDQNQERLHPALHELAAALPGQYSTPARAGSHRRLQLEVIADPSTPPTTVRLIMAQSRSDRPEEQPRQFQWLLQPADGADGIRGSFAPMSAAGQIQRQCAMSVSLRREGVTAQTDPGDCSFGEGEQRTGLLKEIAFDGSQLVIGDRLVRIPSGEPAGADQITRFVRDRAFTGWAGVRDGSDWRMAADVQAGTASTPVEPRDASGMSLGLEIVIDHYEISRTGQIKLRLSVTDSETGELLGEAWTNADAHSIGIALPELQVGLESL
jgi:hypothetical protein